MPFHLSDKELEARGKLHGSSGYEKEMKHNPVYLKAHEEGKSERAVGKIGSRHSAKEHELPYWSGKR